MPLPSAEQLFNPEQVDNTAQLKITRQLVMLHSASCNISASLDSKQVKELIVQEFSGLLSTSACNLGMWNGHSGNLNFVAKHQGGKPDGGQLKTQSILTKHSSLIEKILSRRNVLHISIDTPGADEDILKAMNESGVTSYLLLPLIVNSNPIGLIEILNCNESPYETFEIVIARLLANQAAIAIENARLYQNAKQEIKTRQKTEEKLKYHALHDGLTNLPNRVLFLNRLEHAISKYKRFEQLEYAVLFVDIDRFKRINDSFGHIEGDRALRELADRLLASIRESDTVCRFGGDEFLILLEGDLNSEVIQEITGRIQNNLVVPIRIDTHEFHMTASIGIAYCIQDVENSNEYVRNANIAMYQAKAKGGGRAEIFTQTKELEVRSKVILESAIRDAVRKKDFYIKHQPIFDLDTLSVVGLEVLLRWKRDKAEVPTEKFIPLLENFGLMPEIGLWVLGAAIESYQNLIAQDQKLSPLTISVNISSSQLDQDDFIPQVTKLIDNTKMDPKKLILEITEHTLIDDLTLANNKIRELNALGVKVHLDDFGTGYSSLIYLNELPFQAIKIDRKFVQQVNSIEMDQGIISTILSMARKFDVAVVAEGIETEKQLRGLRFAECKYGQGNFLSPALSEDKLLALLRTSPFLS